MRCDAASFVDWWENQGNDPRKSHAYACREGLHGAPQRLVPHAEGLRSHFGIEIRI